MRVPGRVVLSIPARLGPVAVGEREQTQEAAGRQPHDGGGDVAGRPGDPQQGHETGYHQQGHVGDQDGANHDPTGEVSQIPSPAGLYMDTTRSGLGLGLDLLLLRFAEIPVEQEVLPLGIPDDPLPVPAELRIVGRQE